MNVERTWIRGVSQPLPIGEALLWEGRPDGPALARYALHIRKVAFYFGLIIVVGFGGAVRDGVALPQLLTTLATQVALSLVVLGCIALYARLLARHTIYAITDRRMVMRVGLVLPTTINIPFRLVESARSHRFADGTGQIALRLRHPERVSFFQFWPSVRPWHYRSPEPMLRGLKNTDAVAEMLRVAALATGGLDDTVTAPVTKETSASGNHLHAHHGTEKAVAT
jgi:hypothetical protein